MRIGIISDIHGNTRALKATMEEMPATDVVLLAGDIAGRVAGLVEIFEIIDAYHMYFIKGNHEEMAILYQERFGTNGKVGELVRRLSDAPYRMELQFSGKKFLMAHGSPENPKSEYIYPEYPYFHRFEELGFDFIILGHTHVPMVVRSGVVTIVNPGSVGEPMADNPRPSYAVIDTETGSAKIFFVERYRETERLRYINPFRWARYSVMYRQNEKTGNNHSLKN
jgi:putative phosphoesterase